MPTFDFSCTHCGATFEAQIPMGSKDFPLCEACGGHTKKMITPPAVHFKGGGFYKTDSSAKTEKSEPKEQSKTESKPSTKDEK